MENYQLGGYDKESYNSSYSQEVGQPVVNSTQDNPVTQIADYFDESGNYRTEAFEKLGGLHYMNYLHSHDDML